jgi:anti-anti-sigma factor
MMSDIARFNVLDAAVKRRRRVGRTARRVVRVKGEVDVATSALLAAAIARAMARKPGAPLDLVIDLGRVRFIDVSGIRVLVNAAHQARGRGGTLVLRSPSPALRRMLGVLHLDEVLPVE